MTMKHIITLMALAGTFGLGVADAQKVYELDKLFNQCSVSNDGKVVGYMSNRDPFEMWNPTDNKVEEIGGIAPGLGVGGMAQFSADGKWISGSCPFEVKLSQEWQKVQLDRDYTYTGMAVADGVTVIVGKNPEGNGVAICNTAVNTLLWTETLDAASSTFGVSQPMAAICFGAYDGATQEGAKTGYAVAGKEIMRTDNMGGDFYNLPQLELGNMVSLSAISFYDYKHGVVGVETTEGGAVYLTENGGWSWTEADGVGGIPVSISENHTDTYFMLTKEGKVQKSEGGWSWSDVTSLDGKLNRIRFYSETDGMILGEGIVYRTKDEGGTWTRLNVGDGIPSETVWNDVVWVDDNLIYMVGSGDVIAKSTDGGDSWTWDNKVTSDGKANLIGICVKGGWQGNELLHACSDKGMLYKKFLIESREEITAARYNTESKTWESIGSLGGNDDDVYSSPFAISGDGKTISGLAYLPVEEHKIVTKDAGFAGFFAHAFAWTENMGMIDLGGLNDKDFRGTRVNALNYDGSVAVGYQDQHPHGIWASAVWRKDAEGIWGKNQYVLADSEKEDELMNRLGVARTVSDNGKWIAGNGVWLGEDDYSSSTTWVWSEETGTVDLGYAGYAVDINNEGLLITAQNVWRPGGTLISIYDYLEEIGVDVGDLSIANVQSVSQNGRYLAGFGTNTFCIDLGKTAGIDNVIGDGAATSEVISTTIYNVSGAMTNQMTTGVNIVKEVHADGSVTTKKVLVK